MGKKVYLVELAKRYDIPISTLRYNQYAGAFPDEVLLVERVGRKSRVSIDEEWFALWHKKLVNGELPARIRKADEV